MVSRTFLVGVVLAGITGIAVAQSPSLSPNGMDGAYPGAPGVPGTGQMGHVWTRGNQSVNSVVGSVHTDDNRPLGNVRVELRDGSTGAVLGSSYTGMAGSFEFRELPQGAYDVVAFSGTQTAEERVQVNSMSASVDLRLSGSRPTDGLGNRTVSVNEYHVPEGAREELRKAKEASAKNKHEDALRHLDRALELYPGYPEALTVRATYKLDQRDFEGAVSDLQLAIANDGNCALAYTVLGSAQNVQHKFDDALRSLERAETLAPDVWQTYFEVARAYSGKNEYAESLKALDRAQTLAPPGYPLIPLLRANNLMALSRYSDAVNELQAFIQKNPAGSHTDRAKQMLEQAQAAMSTAKN